MATEKTGQYEVRCDDCKIGLRWTNDVKESFMGGRCAACRQLGQVIAKSQIKR